MNKISDIKKYEILFKKAFLLGVQAGHDMGDKIMPDGYYENSAQWAWNVFCSDFQKIDDMFEDVCKDRKLNPRYWTEEEEFAWHRHAHKGVYAAFEALRNVKENN